MNANWIASALFVAALAVALAALFFAAFVLWLARRGDPGEQPRGVVIVTESARSGEWGNIPAGGYVPRGTVSDSNGNVRVIREVKP